MSDTFVLVHGAWHGAWCWAGVIGELERKGHRALAVDLPGHGANRCDPSHVTRDAYVESVVSFVERHGLENVVLAGHSLAGITIPGVAARIPKRIKRVVFVSALVVSDGQTTADELAPLMAAHADEIHGLAEGAPAFTLDIERFRTGFMQDGSRDLQDFVYSALVPEPTAPLLQPVAMKRFHELGIPASYLVCEDDVLFDDPKVWHPGFSSHLKHATTRSVKAGHEVMFTGPAACAGALIELART